MKKLMIGYIIGAVLGVTLTLILWPPCTEPVECSRSLPSLEEIQTRIGVEPDGIYGEKTREAWDKALCEQYNQEAWKVMANPKPDKEK